LDTGKSSLFQEFAKRVEKKGHVITCKFDELQGVEAFSALTEAFNTFARNYFMNNQKGT
jgi:predicted ATPase